MFFNKQTGKTHINASTEIKKNDLQEMSKAMKKKVILKRRKNKEKKNNKETQFVLCNKL